MTNDELKQLKHGDLIRNLGSGISYTVLVNHGGHATAIRIMDVSNPSEWEVALKANYSKPKRKK